MNVSSLQEIQPISVSVYKKVKTWSVKYCADT